MLGVSDLAGNKTKYLSSVNQSAVIPSLLHWISTTALLLVCVKILSPLLCVDTLYFI